MPVFKLSDLRTKALARLEDNAVLYTQPEIDAIINEAIRCTALFTGFYRATVHVPGFSQANQRVYNTPPGILAIDTVYFEGRLLQKISLKRLARLRRTWATDTTDTRGRVEYWSPWGNTLFVISPQDSQGGRDISATGQAEPPLLVNADDVMVLENEYVEIVTEYCEHRLPLKLGGKIFADGSLALNDFYAKMRQRMAYEKFKFPKYRILQVQPQRQIQQAVAQ